MEPDKTKESSRVFTSNIFEFRSSQPESPFSTNLSPYFTASKGTNRGYVKSISRFPVQIIKYVLKMTEKQKNPTTLIIINSRYNQIAPLRS